MELLTVNDLADYLKISTSKIYKMTSEKEIPHIKIGNTLRFDKKTIDKWLSEKNIRTNKDYKNIALDNFSSFTG